MTKPLSRRQFLKGAAAGGATAAFAPLFGLNARPATAKPSIPERVLHAAAATTAAPFTALPSSLPLGAPLADIAMGDDGTLWAIDTGGVPYRYDLLSQSWEVYVHQIDAITYTSHWQGASASGGGKFALPLVVMGSQITSPVDGKPMQLASAFANLPTSFQLGLDGIAEVGGKLYLFRHGRYVVVDTGTSNNAVVGSPMALTSLTDWPTTGDWAAGTFEALGSNREDPNDSYVHLFGYGEWMLVDLVQGAVRSVSTSYDPGPAPLHEYVAGKILQEMQKGFSALLFRTSKYTEQIYQGGVAWLSTDLSGNDATPSYANVAQAAGWTPVLAHAPSGSARGLWGVSTNVPVRNTGSGWQLAPYDPAFERCTAISEGSDGSVFCLTSDGFSWGLRRLQQDATWSATLTITNITLAQLEVGDATHIWARDTNNVIYRYHNGSFSTVSGFAAATHIAANADGTVWAANNAGVAYRFISEGKADATGLAAAAGTVTRVASTGFATAFALAQHPTALAANGSPATQLYAYDSPYVWKTSDSYIPRQDYQGLTQSIAFSGHTVFTTSYNGTHTIAAIDAQTCVQLWTYPYETYPDPSKGMLGPATALTLSYDPALNLLYVSGGRFLDAIDATTGTRKWQYDPRPTKSSSEVGLLGPAITSGGLLAVTDRIAGLLLLFDTSASLNNGTPHMLWSQIVESSPPQGSGQNSSDWIAAGTPVFDSGAVYVVSQVQGSTIDVNAFNLSDGTPLWHQALPAATLQFNLIEFQNKLPLDAVLGQTTNPTPTPNIPTVPVLLVNAGLYVYALDPSTTGNKLASYTLPQLPNTDPVYITSGLSYWKNQLFFGDSQAQLTTVNTLTMTRTARTSDSFNAWLGVTGQPSLIHTNDPNDGLVVFFVRGDDHLWLFDPTSGNLESIATDQTNVAAMTYDQIHGLLYATGLNSSNTNNNTSLGQVFALRPDQAIQDERDFIIESQLMQDYGSDDEATNSNGVARYQTHVSVVDSNKAAQPRISVKLWAEDDTNATMVSIDGSSFTIGTTQPALITTDGTGSFVVTSTASDLSTTSFRLWAAFMDASERITITPDAEFHGRLASATATGNSDPRQVDLVSAQSYDGTTLFSSSEQSTAQQAAQGMTNTLSAVGVGTSSTSDVQLRLQQTSSLPKYTAYAALPSMAYSPVNAAAKRSLSSTASLGLSFTATGYARHTPGEATDLIDAMQGTALTGELGSVLSSLRSAWKEIKATAAKVKQVVVSIADEVYVGITYVVNGITKVVKDVAHDIDDALAAIGSFFVQLGKDLIKAVEALSLLLHLGEVVKTAHIISAQINTTLSTLKDTLTAAKTDFDAFFADADKQIENGFCHLFDILQLPEAPGCGTNAASPRTTSATPLTGLNGMGATPTTIYNSGQSGGSQAVQCGWSSHMMRTQVGSAAETTVQLEQADDFIHLLDTFYTNVTTNPNLKQAYSDVGSTFSATFKATSPKEFLAMAVEDLLELLKAILITGVTIVQSLVDTLLGAIDTMVQQMQNLGSVQIPILSALWKKLTGNGLTFLDLLSFVLAFPTTLLYRAATGSYPSASSNVARDLGGTASAHASLAITPSEVQMIKGVMGLVGAAAYVVGGIIKGVTDTTWATKGAEGDFTPSATVEKCSGVCTLFQIVGTSLFSQTDVSGATRQQSIARGVMIIAFRLTPLIAKIRREPLPPGAIATVTSWVGTIFGAWGMVSAGLQFATSESKNILILYQAIVSQIPSLVNPIKFAGPPEAVYPYIAPLADVVFNLEAAGLLAAEAIGDLERKSAERQYFMFLPVASKS